MLSSLFSTLTVSKVSRAVRRSHIGMESTGTYHELFANIAHQLGFIVFVLNPKDARHYAKAVELRGKTDRVDAELIARMIAHEHTKLYAWTPPTPEQHEIARLIECRAKLSSLRQALGMSLKGVDGFAAELKALRKRFDQVIARIDQRVKVGGNSVNLRGPYATCEINN